MEDNMEKKNTAVVTVVGNDTIGIIARVSAALAHHEANILDISQTVLSGMFNMIMIVDISLSRFAHAKASGLNDHDQISSITRRQACVTCRAVSHSASAPESSSRVPMPNVTPTA